MGLHEKQQAWKYISESEYNNIKSYVGTALPSMSIAVIKRDQNGLPYKSKYRIVVLGNLDPNSWDKTDCYAPVMSQLEMRIILSLAVYLNVNTNSGDFSQAFCQSYLPDGETYMIKPPKGCPIIPTNTYLLLRKTLYGLKLSPRHWYNKACNVFTSIGLHRTPNSPCLFHGLLYNSNEPLIVGLHVDDFIFFCKNKDVIQKFELELSSLLDVEFDHSPKHFIGMKIHSSTQEGKISIYMNQQVVVDALLDQADFDQFASPKYTPYRSGMPVDKIEFDNNLPMFLQVEAQNTLQSIVGTLNWLAVGTRPDIATITNILSQYLHKANQAHVKAAKHVIQYLKGSKTLGIKFSTKTNPHLDGFIKFPIPNQQLGALTDANWGPQDASVPKSNTPVELELFKSPSISGYLIWFNGPLYWSSKRQTITARSSAEAEIYATDECVKVLQHIHNIFQDLGFHEMNQN